MALHPDDDVVVAKVAIALGAEIHWSGDLRTVSTRERIAPGHKLAVRRVPAGGPVRKYGQTIGFAARDIEPGDWVHVHNLRIGERDAACQLATDVPAAPAAIVGRTFSGYRRADGRAGTRNYLAIVSTVNCSATVAKAIAERIVRSGLLNDYPHVDGIVALAHKGGCAIQQGGEDHRQLNRVLAGFARHSNVGGSLIVGLGCETAQGSFLAAEHDLVQLDCSNSAGNSANDRCERPPLVMNIQEQGGVAKMVDRAAGVLRELLPEVDRARRAPVPVSELVLGLQCGGSDGNSGITANPALGVACDLLVAHGGTAVLAETPEIVGAEHLLTRRAVSAEVARKLLERIAWWQEHTAKFGVELDNNPSVGNKAGGLSTIYEKSLGAVAKGGGTALRAVYGYAEAVAERGLVFMDTPGFDPASVTGLVAGGANLVAFTTGRGSCFGCKPVPSFKIATNSAMYARMSDDMDLDAGRILDGARVEEVGREIFERLIAVAGGAKTKSEAQGIGDEEFCPWSIGPTL
ncbi:MAG: altronate dehydratase family protein [Planctomycetales bacterium]